MALQGRKPPIPAASGYPQYFGALTSPVFAKGFTESFYPKTISGNITTQNIKGVNIREVGDEIIFRTEPEAEIFKYTKNQDLEHSHLETSTYSMVINRARYFNLKLDEVDEALVPNIQEFIRAFQNSAQRKLAQLLDHELLLEIPQGAAMCNKGRNAGVRSRSYDLGAAGTPVALNAENLPLYLSFLRSTLLEQNVDPSNMYVVLPTEAQVLFYSNPVLMNACASGQGKSILFMEKIPNVMGMTIYFSNMMPQYDDPSGKTAYTIIAGKKEATGFVQKLTKTDIVKDSRSFGKMWRGLNIYDFKVLTPEAVSVLYATINFNP